MFTDSSAFATLGDVHCYLWFTVHGTPFNSFSSGFHTIRSMSHVFGWPCVSVGWKAIPFKDIFSPNLDFHNHLNKKERKVHFPPKKMNYQIQPVVWYHG